MFNVAPVLPVYGAAAGTATNDPVFWSTHHWYVGAVVTPGLTVNDVFPSSHIVVVAGWPDISGFSRMVSNTVSEVTAGLQAPPTTTRYMNPFIPELAAVMFRVAVFTPL